MNFYITYNPRTQTTVYGRLRTSICAPKLYDYMGVKTPDMHTDTRVAAFLEILEDNPNATIKVMREDEY